ncbi:lymphocyte antigen 6L [Rhynchocyon petersi]
MVGVQERGLPFVIMEGFVLRALLVSVELTSVCVLTGTLTASKLMCYQCFKVPSHDCCAPVSCAPNDTVCVAHEVVMTIKSERDSLVTRVSKRCAPRCPNGNNIQEWSMQKNLHIRLTRQCCSRNFCNSAPLTHLATWVLPGELLLWALLP